MCGLEVPFDPNLIVGIERVDDAGVYRLTEDLALIHTVDFFTPIVDDPYWFGQIAAANALSDVYAMGGRPLTAMNIVCFPVKDLGVEVLREVLKGGLEKMKEAGVVLVGGHSVEDQEMKYGLAVIGVVHPEKVVRNQGARPGDLLVLTKPIGTGVIATAIKAQLLKEETVRKVTLLMAELNRKASEAMVEVEVSACTDVTGFGLLGHACEMVDGTDVGLKVYASKVPFIKEALELAQMGLLPAGAYRNRDYRKGMVFWEGVDEVLFDLLFDPQTSGGLLIAVPRQKEERLMGLLEAKGVKASIIGEFTSEHPSRVRVLP